MNLPSRSGEGQLAGVALTFRAVLRGTSGSPKDRLEYWIMPSPDSQAHQKKQSKMDCFLKYMIRVSKVGFFREQVSYFEGFILKIAKKKNYTLFNSLDVI